ncbi:MAG: hypothetical protein CL678_14195 [Bdellovibrionaceae bacterium]|nr:hypothetical protein [Pseudobdellovibrionaceae bacterium]|tara:strand:+ start:891 stop:1673 length:783 start_codon:yes stop_codon:yes gene_type:complete
MILCLLYVLNTLINLSHGRQIFTVNEITQELSGMRRIGQSFWTIGDSNTGSYIGKTNLTSMVQEKITIKGIKNQDWEALISDSKNHIWILDTGDNKKKRKFLSLYEIDPTHIKETAITPVRKIQLIYSSPESRRKNIEAGIYKDGFLYLFEKTKKGSKKKPDLFRINLKSNSSKTQLLKKISELPPLSEITDAAYFNNQIYLLTYQGIFKCISDKKNFCSSYQKVNSSQHNQQESLIVLDRYFWIGNEDGAIFEEIRETP